MGVYEGVQVLSTRGHVVLLRVGQSLRGRGSLLPWGLTGLLQGSRDWAGGRGLEQPSPHASGAKCHPARLGMDARDPGEHSWDVGKPSPELMVCNGPMGPVRWGEGEVSTCAAKHLGRRGAPGTAPGTPRGRGSAQVGRPWPCRASSRKDREDGWTSMSQEVESG